MRGKMTEKSTISLKLSFTLTSHHGRLLSMTSHFWSCRGQPSLAGKWTRSASRVTGHVLVWAQSVLSQVWKELRKQYFGQYQESTSDQTRYFGACAECSFSLVFCLFFVLQANHIWGKIAMILAKGRESHSWCWPIGSQPQETRISECKIVPLEPFYTVTVYKMFV